MDLQRLKTRIIADIDEFQNVLNLTKEVENDQKSVNRQNAILTQKSNALSQRELDLKRDQEKVENERSEIFTQKEKNERQFVIMDKQKSDYRVKMGEMKAFQTQLEEKLEKVKELEQREKEVIVQEENNANESKKLAHREGLIAKEKEIIRDRKIQLDKLEEKKKAKLARLTKILGE